MSTFLKISIIILLVQTLGSAQGGFYTINHQSKVMLKESEKTSLENAYYETEDWSKCILYLEGNPEPIEHAAMVDLYNKSLDIDLAGKKRSVPFSELDSFVIHEFDMASLNRNVLTSKSNSIDVSDFIVSDRQFYSSTLFGMKESGILEVVKSGKISLLKLHKVKIKRANYNVVIGTGATKDSYIVDYDFYFLTADNELIEIPTRSKPFNKVISQFSGASSFVKNNSIDPDKVSDLVLLVNEINKNKS